jgi:hypothetical protein
VLETEVDVEEEVMVVASELFAVSLRGFEEIEDREEDEAEEEEEEELEEDELEEDELEEEKGVSFIISPTAKRISLR